MKRKFAFLLTIFIVFVISGFGQEPPLFFVMLSDPQLGMYANNMNFVRETANYEFSIAAVNRLKPAFVIVLGDLINKDGDAEQIREFQRISQKIDPSVRTYYVAGNHDVGAQPTKETLAAYRQSFGRDYYSFRAGPIYGIVLNSSLIHTPKSAESEYEEQIFWLKGELEKAKESGAPHIVIFQHHPYFVSDVQEPEQWGNIPLERRKAMLELLHKYGVRYVFAGHVHRNFVAKDGDLEMTATGPVAMPFGNDGSGIRLAEVTATGIRHRYFDFGRMPDGLAIK